MRQPLSTVLVVLLAIVALSASSASAQPLAFSQGSDLGVYSIGTITPWIYATGGTAPYTWEVVGSLPSGFALRQHTEVADSTMNPPVNSVGVYGVASAAADLSFTLRLRDSAGANVTQTFNLRVDSFTIIDQNLPEAYLGTAYNHTLTTGNSPGAVTWAQTNGALPPGLTLNETTGQIGGTPTAAGLYNFTVSATSGSLTIYRGLAIWVPEMWIATNPILSANPGVPFSIPLQVSGGTPHYAWSVTHGALSINSSGVLSGTLWDGDHDFWVTVTDSLSRSYTRRVSLLIGGPSAQLVGVSAWPVDDMTVGDFACAHLFMDGGKAPFTWSATGLPAGVTIRSGAALACNAPPAGAELAGRPLQTGNYTVSVSVTDSSPTPITATRTVTLRVVALNLEQNLLAAFGAPFSGFVRPIGGTGPYTFALADGMLPAGLSLNTGTGAVTGTLLQANDPWKRVRITDGSGQELVRNVWFNIQSPGTIGVSSGPLGEYLTGAPLTLNLGAWGAGSITWTLEPGSTLPSGLSLSANGVLTGSPNVSGHYKFMARAREDGNAANYSVGEWEINITPIVITDWSPGWANSGGTVNYTFRTAGADGATTWALAPGDTLPPGLSLSSAGVLTGTTSVSGRFWFSVVVTDSSGNTRRIQTTLDLYPAGMAPPVSINVGTQLRFQSGRWEYPLWASGGNGAYTWSVASGTLPPGISLRTDACCGAQATLLGVATQPGNYTFSLRAASGASSDTREFTAQIDPVGPRDWWDIPDAFAGVDFSYTFASVLPGAFKWELQPGSNPLPPGLVLDQNTGKLSGAPTTPGTYNFGIRINYAGGYWDCGFTITVYAVRILGSSELPQAKQGVPYAPFTFGASGGRPAYTWSAQWLPSGLTLSSGGALTGTPTAPGTYWFSIFATDADQQFYSRQFALNVVGDPLALPAITTQAFVDDFALGNHISLDIWVNGGTAPFTWSLQNAPSWLTLRTGAAAPKWTSPYSANIFGLPPAADTYEFTVKVTDSSPTPVTVTRTYRIRVSALDLDMPFQNAMRGLPYTDRFRFLGGTAPYTFEVIDGRLPAGLSVNAATGAITGTPLENGSIWGRARLRDASGLELIRGFNINVGSPDTTVAVNETNLAFTTGQPFQYQLWASGAPSYTWSFVEPDPARPAWVSLSAGGMLSGTPPSNGTYTALVRATDQTNPANYGVRQVIIRATPIIINVPPVGYANVSSGYSLTFTATGAVGALTWSLTPETLLPAGMTFAGGVLSGTPTSPGQYYINVIAKDAAGNSRQYGITLNVYPAGQRPPLYLGFGPNIGPVPSQATDFELRASGGQPPYTYSIAPAAPTVPGMRVQNGQPFPNYFPPDATGAFLGIPTLPAGTTAPVSYPTTIRVTDSAGSTYDRAITVTVTPFGMASSGSRELPRTAVQTPYNAQLLAAGGTEPYLWTLRNGSMLPPGLQLSGTGQVTGTPTQAGIFWFDATATEATGMSVTENFRIDVGGFSISTAGTLTDATSNSPYNVALTTAGGTAPYFWSVVWGGLPGGISLNPSTGVISGSSNSVGVWRFRVRVNDAGGRWVEKMFSLTVQPPSPAPLAFAGSTDFGTAELGARWVLSLSAVGGTPPYTWAVEPGSQLPPGFALAAGDTLCGECAPGTYIAGRMLQTGAFSFNLRVTDAASNSRTAAFTITGTRIFLYTGDLPRPGPNPLRYNTPYSEKLLAYGGSGSYTFTAEQPLPPGLSLSSGGTVTGTPSNTGFFPVRIAIADGSGNTYRRSVNINISSGTAATLWNSLPADLGTIAQTTVYQRTISGFGSPSSNPNYSISLVAPSTLPPGLSLRAGPTGAAGEIYGQPAGSGTFTFTLRVQDSAGNFGVMTHTLRISPVTIFTGSLNSGAVTAPYSMQLIAYGGTGRAWSVAAGSSLPPGMTLSADGVLGGTPTTAGNFNFTLVVTDTASGLQMSRGYSISIAPIAINAPDFLVAVATVPFSYTFTATGGGTTKTWSLASGSTLPDGMTLSPAGVLSGTFDYTMSGWQFTVRVSDGAQESTKRMRLTVRTPNVVPLNIGATYPDGSVGVQYQATLGAGGGAPPYTWSLPTGSTLPPGLMLVSGPALPANFTVGSTLIVGMPTTAGSYSFPLELQDGLGTRLRRTVTIKISAIGLVGYPSTATFGVPYSYTLAPAGGTPPYTFELLDGSLQPGLTLSTAGVITGTPATTGTNTVLLRITAAGSTLLRNVSVTTVATSAATLSVNLASSPSVDAVLGTLVGNTLSASGGTPPYTFSVEPGSPLPPGLSLITSSPPPGYSAPLVYGRLSAEGTFTCRLRATDALGNYGVSAITVNVHTMSPVGSPVPPATVGQPISFPAIRFVGTHPPFTFSVPPTSVLPPGISMSSTGVVSGTPAEPGIFAFAYKVTDASGRTVTRTFSLDVLPPGQNQPLRLTPRFDSYSIGVNMPYSFNLDQLTGGGAWPYTWSLDPGSSLPAGISLVPTTTAGTYLAGAPTAIGSHKFRLIVTDSKGSVATVVMNLNVVSASLTPPVLPRATVGQPYSVAVVASGGTPPYDVQLMPGVSLPAGVSFSGGTFSGTPQVPGWFDASVYLTDGTGATVPIDYSMWVDSADTPYSIPVITPTRLRITYYRGDPSPETTPVTIDTGVQPLAFTAAIAGIPGASLSETAGTTPRTVQVALSPAALAGVANGTYYGVISAVAPGYRPNYPIGIPVVLTVADPPPCAYTVAPDGANIAAGGGTGTANVTTSRLCSWTAASSDSWLTFTTAASGSGNGSVGYQVSSNPNSAQRTATVTIGGSQHKVTQFGTACSFGIDPLRVAATAAGGTATIAVNSSAADCGWTSSNSLPWVAITAGTSGTGSGTTTISIAPNAAGTGRTGTVTIANQTLNVEQAGADCKVTLASGGASMTPAAGGGSVGVSLPAGCGYSTVAGPSWITVTTGGSGSGPGGTLEYSVAANSTTQSRTGALMIGGQPYQITQQPVACSFSVASSETTFGVSQATGTVSITANGPNCDWSASSGAPEWLNLTSSSSGRGSSSVSFRVTDNSGSTIARTGVLTVAGQSVTITQSGTECAYNLRSGTATVPAGGAAGAVGVVAPAVCSWSASSNDGWLTVSAPAGGAGSGTNNVAFTATANPNTTERTGTLTIQGLTFTVTQPGRPCTFSLTSTSTTVSPAGAPGSFGVSTTDSACTPPEVRSYADWISVTPAVGPTGGTVTFTVAANLYSTPRSGTIQAGDQTYSITQTAAACAFTLNAYGAVFNRYGGNGQVLASASALGCNPDVGASPELLPLPSLIGPAGGIFTQPYAVPEFNSIVSWVRRLQIHFSGTVFTVKQTSW